MKSNRLMPILIGGLLAFQVCPKSAGLTVTLVVANDVSVAAGRDMRTQHDTNADFAASLLAVNPNDGSSASVAQVISFADNTIKGSGRLKVAAGMNGVIDASGETSVYMQITVDAPAHYEFLSTFLASGGTAGEVSFYGLANSAGSLTAEGTIREGYFYSLHAFNAPPQYNACSGSWSFALSLTPTNVPVLYTKSEKAGFLSQSTAAAALAVAFMNLAYNGHTTGPLAADLIVAAKSEYAIQDKFYAAYLDPLDTNYTVLAEAVAPTVIPLAAGGGITQTEADDYNVWLTNVVQTDGYSSALTTSINRAQGAAYAGNSYWETAQINAAVQFRAQLAGLLDQEPALRSNVLAQFEADGFQAITATTNDAVNLQQEITTNGLPAVLLDGLTELGTDAATITNIENKLLTTDPNSMAGSFPGSLSNTNLDSAQRALAGALRDASMMLIHAQVLAGGQFRFDLPTEPGYAYTIQSSQNLADSSSWTTIVSNVATTTLLSFTNTPPSNAPAVFYRASHN